MNIFIDCFQLSFRIEHVLRFSEMKNVVFSSLLLKFEP